MSKKKKSSQQVESQPTVQSNSELLFSSKNYKLMILGLIVIFVGFALMLGKNNVDPSAAFPADEIYSFRRIILAPAIVLIGFGIEIYSILLIKRENNT